MTDIGDHNIRNPPPTKSTMVHSPDTTLPNNITSIQISTRGVGPPRQKKNFNNHQSSKRNRIRRQENQPRRLPTKDSTKTKLPRGTSHPFRGQIGDPPLIQHLGWIPHTIPSKELEIGHTQKCNANLRNRTNNLDHP